VTALFEQGFFVRKPAWHRLGTVLDDYPGREEAMRLAGHDFTIETESVYVPVPGYVPRFNQETEQEEVPDRQYLRRAVKFKALMKAQMRAPEDCDATNGTIINITNETYVEVQNQTCWDIAEAIIGASSQARYETGVTLDSGRKCAITFWLDTPTQIKGDDSPIYPYGFVNWAHDGTGSVKAGATNIRIVCANTLNAAEMQADASGRIFVFRHTKNIHDRIEDAKLVLQGIQAGHQEFIELGEEAAKIKVTRDQRELFIQQFIPIPPGSVISDRVVANIDDARTKLRNLFDGPTIPDAHKLTGYGLMQAGVEYLDHLRGFRTNSTYVGRTLLRPEPLKLKLMPLIKEVAHS